MSSEVSPNKKLLFLLKDQRYVFLKLFKVDAQLATSKIAIFIDISTK